MAIKNTIFGNSYIAISVKASRLTLTRVLDELHRRKLTILRVHIGSGELDCRIRSGDYAIAQEVCTLFNADICKVKAFGNLGRANKLKANAALVVGMMIAVAIVAIMGQQVLKIDIKCDNPLYLGQIEQLVASQGVKHGARINSIDYDKIEREISGGVKDVVMCTVYRDGIAVVVDVVTTPQSPVSPDKYSSILSTRDGIVTRIVVRSGTSVVKVDDRVTSGALLIDGYINSNKSDYQKPDEAVRVSVPAEGEVYAKVYYHKRLYVSDTRVLTNRTNNVKIIREYYIRGQLLGKAHTPPYDRYERVSVDSKISLILPILVKTHYYYEVTEEVISYDAYREAMLVKLKAELFGELPASATVMNEWVVPQQGNESVIDYYMEVEQRIDIGGNKYE